MTAARQLAFSFPAAPLTVASPWVLSSSSDREALDIVDGRGDFEGHGPHYSRRTPGSRTFTGVGREIVLVHESGKAVWACVYQRTPTARGTGSSRGRGGERDAKPRHIWRNMMFRNLGAGLSSTLIRSATEETYRRWVARYGSLPAERLRTEIGIREVRSPNPGFCYKAAGWVPDRIVRGKLYLWAPCRHGIPAQIPHATSRNTTRPGRFERPTVGLEGRRSLHESALFRGRFEADGRLCGECAESNDAACAAGGA